MNFKKIFSSIIGNASNYKKIELLYKNAQDDYKSAKVNLGQIQSELNKNKKQIKSLAEVEFHVFSQFGDDGIIQWLINQLPIKNKTFIEFGVENYRESNTRFLLINNYWSGLVIDGLDENVKSIQNEQLYNFYDLQAISSFITCDNINELLSKSKFEKEIGILSIDIDGNDYWVWESINLVEPVIVIVEYNSLFGFENPHTIHYQADFVRGTKERFNFYGTSLQSIYQLSLRKGYSFIGCNSAGNNAYFVKNEYMQFLSINSLSPKDGYVFANFTEAWDNNGVPLRGIDKIKSIEGLKVMNTENSQVEQIDSNYIIKTLIEAKKMKRF